MDTPALKQDRFSSNGFIVALAAVLTFGIAVALAEKPPRISTLKQLLAMPPAQLSEGLPFEFEGTVLCYNEEQHQLVLHGREGTYCLNPDGLHTDFSVGDVVKVAGQTQPAREGLPLTALRAVVLRHAEHHPAGTN